MAVLYARTEEIAAVQGFNLAMFRACKELGGVYPAAGRLGIDPALLYRYRSGSVAVPQWMADKLEAETGGKVTAAEIMKCNKRTKAARLLERAARLLDEAA